ncbi:hypothetical protein B9Z55_004545 [Caenorhabditis nigoni]|uniref:Domain of unknown function WSN domain-containing protein n=1 Tax=Caenorhabditis nigoni TaxID=1611254 RepID=A0A2G5UX07_9PELO|nr:hypothetical protein B9Z55_004545 [Caenorhabditis nigoni]
MRKILKFLSLLLIVNVKYTASAKSTSTSALQLIIEKFESLSRITNGLALQKELNSKSLEIDHLLAEILEINPKNNGFEELRMFKIDDLSKRYAKFSNDASTVKKSEIDESMVKSQLDVLGKMGEDLEVLKSGEPLNLDEIVEKGKNVFRVDYGSFDGDFNDFPLALNNTFNLNKGNYKDDVFKSSFKTTVEKTAQFWSKVEKFMKFEETFKDLWAINGSFSQLEPLRKLGKVADVYKNSYANLTKLRDNMGTLNKDIPVLIPFIKKSPEIGNLNKDLGKLYGMFEKYSIPNPSTRLLTAGLTRGTQDIKRLFQDVNALWFKKSVANDNEKILMKMKSDLNGLKMLNEDMAKTEVHWNSFKTKIDTVKVKKSLDLVYGSSEHVTDINSFETLQSSSSEVEGCLMDLNQISVNVEFENLNKILNQLESIEKAALELEPLLVEFSKIAVFKNKKIFESLKSALDEIDKDLNVMLLQQEVDKLRANPEYNKFLERSLEACKLVLKMRETGIINLLFKTIEDWDILTNTKNALNDTSLIQTLECLQQKKFDASGISKLLTFGSMVRLIGDEHKTDKSVETFIGKMGQFQKSLKNLKSSVRPKRSSSDSTVDSLQNGLTVSQDLSKGADLLRKMGNLYGKKKDLDMVVAGGKEVFLEIQKMITSIDSEKLESEMKKTSEDLQKLESNAKNYPNPSLRIMGEFFENASTIHGVSIDSKLLANPVAVSFEKSSNQKIQRVAVPLKTLGSLQLDFSSGRSDFKSAQLSISKLQEFFDQIFPLSRNSQNAESEPFDMKTIGIYGGSGLVFIAILIGFIFLTRWIVKDRKRSNPNYYIHLLDSGNESILMTETACGRECYRLPIHQAIRDRNLDELKACIMNGANVNAFTFLDEKYVTPLHMAVENKEFKMTKLLIMNGADRNLKNSRYKTPEECIHETDHEMKNVFKELRGKTFRRRLPKQFPKSSYLVYGSFPDRWRSQKVNQRESATHMELWDGKKHAKGEELIDIDLMLIEDATCIKYLFLNNMIMNSTWKMECRKWWRLWIPVDYKHRATKVKINGKVYETIVKIHQHMQETRIPFLEGFIAYFIGFDKENKISKGVCDALVECMTLLGVNKIVVDGHPKANADVFQQGDDFPPKPYYFDNMGHVFIIVGCPISDVSQIDGWNPQYLTCNRFSVMTAKELFEFLFKFEPHHYKLSGKEDKTTFKSWQPFNATN